MSPGGDAAGKPRGLRANALYNKLSKSICYSLTVLSDECEPLSVAPAPTSSQAVQRPRHSARAPARAALQLGRVESDSFWLKWLQTKPWTEANICRLRIRRNRCMPRRPTSSEVLQTRPAQEFRKMIAELTREGREVALALVGPTAE